jgi:dihydroorotate dehydrogenase
MYKDLGIFSELQTGLRGYLEEKKVESIKQLVGLACRNNN